LIFGLSKEIGIVLAQKGVSMKIRIKLGYSEKHEPYPWGWKVHFKDCGFIGCGIPNRFKTKQEAINKAIEFIKDHKGRKAYARL
jgi:hypothetical protein